MPTAKVSVVVLATASAEPKVRSSRIKRARFEVGTLSQMRNFCRPVPSRYKVWFLQSLLRKEVVKDLVVADIHV